MAKRLDKDALLIDGSRGEGGGQILRSSVSLAAILGRELRIVRIRAGRPKSGLSAQHLASVRAVAEICSAELEGDALGSLQLDFRPRRAPRAGRYSFNVAAARKGGSAGAASLVLQSALLPLALTGNASELALLGGTHVPWSPPFDFLEQVFFPLLAKLGLKVELDLRRPGFYPVGGGRFSARIQGVKRLQPLQLERPGRLLGVQGTLTLAGLDEQVAVRLEETTQRLLAPLGVAVEIERKEAESRSLGVALFLRPDYERGFAGFSAVGERGKPAEQVAAEACEELLLQHASNAAVDVRLADQLLLPLCFASGASVFTTARASSHLRTNAAIVEQFGLAKVQIEERSGLAQVTVHPRV
jgi:RNA 3'-terminal phosphate cyclase (ATP)